MDKKPIRFDKAIITHTYIYIVQQSRSERDITFAINRSGMTTRYHTSGAGKKREMILLLLLSLLILCFV